MPLKICISDSICMESFIRTGIVKMRSHFESMNSLLSLTVQHQNIFCLTSLLRGGKKKKMKGKYSEKRFIN